MANTKRFTNPTSHRRMIKAELAWVNDPLNIATTNSIPAFETAMTNLQSKSDNIDALYASKSSIITGITVQKNLARIELANSSYYIMSGVRAYAIDQNNQQLANDMTTSLSNLKYMPFQMLADKITAAIATVTPLVSSLTSYNITSGNITSWTADLTNLNNLLEGPDSAINRRKLINGQIDQALFDIMYYLTTTCDSLSNLFIQNESAYYDGYIANRKLKPTGHVITKLRVFARFSGGGPVMEGQVFLLGTDISGDLDLNGFCSLENIPHGTYRFAVATISSTPVFGPIEIKQGHSLTKRVSLPPAAEAPKTTEAPVEAPKAETSLKNSNTNLN